MKKGFFLKKIDFFRQENENNMILFQKSMIFCRFPPKSSFGKFSHLPLGG